MDYCKLCTNKEQCSGNHWCITMDAQRKINNEYICDNFELVGRTYNNTKYELHSCQNAIKSLQKIRAEQQEIIEMMAEDLAPLKTDNKGGVAWTSIGVKEYYFEKIRGEQNE